MLPKPALSRWDSPARRQGRPRDSHPRREPRSLHQIAPLRTMGPHAAAVKHVNRRVCCLMAEHLFQQGLGALHQPICKREFASRSTIAAERRPQPDARAKCNGFRERRDSPQRSPTREALPQRLQPSSVIRRHVVGRHGYLPCTTDANGGRRWDPATRVVVWPRTEHVGNWDCAFAQSPTERC
jgi:hypothetical protein